ncbi:MAG: DUF424 family protein [Candidatus Woesearchaeota archaeon]|jgi:hypothetical protein
MKFIVSEKSSPNGIILIITDIEIIGKKHEQGHLQLDLENKFYHGSEKNEKEVIELIKSAYILHLTGTAAVGLALKEGLVEKGKWITIKGIPHAEVVLG